MAELSVSAKALKDIARIESFYMDIDPSVAANALSAIADGLEIVTRHPEIGHPNDSGLRILVMKFGKSGFSALYAYNARSDVVSVLRIRHQRENAF
jgi:plasmid stabilization system protein ParE